MPQPSSGTFGSSFANYDQNGVNCSGYGDPLCGYTLKCYECITGYTLNNGFCLTNQCLQYGKYNSSAGGTFSSANCFCYTGFSILFPAYCMKCHINCATCTGTNSN